jgi:6-pyruvoyl-tetrahydropterin synthase
MEVAHRLFLQPGKCQNIHGHSMSVELNLYGELDKNGILAGLDFADVKKAFRVFIDDNFDHQLHLNADDPWARELVNDHNYDGAPIETSAWSRLPGLSTWPSDPTTENFALWICEWVYDYFVADNVMINSVTISIRETETNGAECTLP